MTIKDLYNTLEKAIDSGEATVNTEVWCSNYTNGMWEVVSGSVDEEGDFVILIN